MNKTEKDFPHIDKYTLELVSKGCGGIYKTANEIVMSVANNLKDRLPCGCAGCNYYVIQRDGQNILEQISQQEYADKKVEEVIHLQVESTDPVFSIFSTN